MPAKPAWLLHIPEIIAQLEVFEVPVLDRAIVESLFGLRRRQAIELLHHFGGYKSGQTFLVERQRLLGALRRLADGEDCQSEVRRRERLQETVDRLRRDRGALQVKIPVSPEVWNRKMATLPSGITLEAGRLQVDFDGSEDLLAKLYELARAAANDYDRFRTAAEPVDPRRDQEASGKLFGTAAPSASNKTAYTAG